MKNKGFTLVELLAVIALLAIILMVVVPNILKSYDNSKQDLYDVMVNNICDATSDYYKEYQAGLIQSNNSMICTDKSCEVALDELMNYKYLDKDLRNPLTDKELALSAVKISINTYENESGYEKIQISVDIDKKQTICNE